ncbi:hypothetical protein C8F04DRAFT_1173138 [Mycena alexandri]|uniref:Uncharacterized protein n=1 Tax=Mycena alexandri TaxID=1745969 RepID=A0AAD6XBD9_9AGAR|nr:hypothetical protein C8F04DRAFT_1173138 [Mycena alexandri]
MRQSPAKPSQRGNATTFGKNLTTPEQDQQISPERGLMARSFNLSEYLYYPLDYHTTYWPWSLSQHPTKPDLIWVNNAKTPKKDVKRHNKNVKWPMDQKTWCYEISSGTIYWMRAPHGTTAFLHFRSCQQNSGKVGVRGVRQTIEKKKNLPDVRAGKRKPRREIKKTYVLRTSYAIGRNRTSRPLKMRRLDERDEGAPRHDGFIAFPIPPLDTCKNGMKCTHFRLARPR